MKAEEKFLKLGFFKIDDEEEITYFKSKITETDHIIFNKQNKTVCCYREEHPFCKIKPFYIDEIEIKAILAQLSEMKEK